MDCTYCGCDVTAHDPVFVTERADEGDETVPVGQFCNYGCLVAHVEAEDLVTGTACNWPPED
ncbi:MAG: hypothetical protein ABEJ23_08030 [Haloarculaceae archaeon]